MKLIDNIKNEYNLQLGRKYQGKISSNTLRISMIGDTVLECKLNVYLKGINIDAIVIPKSDQLQIYVK